MYCEAKKGLEIAVYLSLRGVLLDGLGLELADLFGPDVALLLGRIALGHVAALLDLKEGGKYSFIDLSSPRV